MAISVSDFRQFLPQYLKRVQQGEELEIANHGKVIARLVPNDDNLKQQQAQEKLAAWRNDIVLHEVVDTSALVEWSTDEDNL